MAPDMVKSGESDRATTLGRDSAVYALGSVLGMMGGLLLLPFVTRGIGTASFGALELFNRVVDIAVLVGLLGMRQAFIRYYFERDEDQWRRSVVSTSLVFTAAVAGLAVFVGYGVQLGFPDVRDMGGFRGDLFGLLGLAIASQLAFQMFTVYLQVRREAVLFVAAQAASLVLYVGLAIAVLLWTDLGVRGVVLANIIAMVVVGVPVALRMLRQSGWGFDRKQFKAMMKFGLPYVPAAALGFIASSADRFILAAYVPLEVLGVYALAARVASAAMSLVATPLGRVWAPFAFAAMHRGDAPKTLGQALLAFLVIVASAGVGIVAVTPLFLPLLAPAEFQAALLIAPVFCVAEAIRALTNMADIGVLIAKRTDLKPAMSAVGGGVTIAVLWVMVPMFGVSGAAVAMLLSAVFFLVMTVYISQRCFRVDWSWPDVARCVVYYGCAVAVLGAMTAAGVTAWAIATVGIGIVGLGAWFFRSALLDVFRQAVT